MTLLRRIGWPLVLAMFAVGFLCAADEEQQSWMKEAIRPETTFDPKTFVSMDPKTGEMNHPTRTWPKATMKLGNPPFMFEVRIARFPTPQEASRTLDFIRGTVSTGGEESIDSAGIADQFIYFGRDTILVRRHDVLMLVLSEDREHIQLVRAAEEPKTWNDLLVGVGRDIVGRLERVRTESAKAKASIPPSLPAPLLARGESSAAKSLPPTPSSIATTPRAGSRKGSGRYSLIFRHR